MPSPEQCRDITQIREEIDQIDFKLIELIALRQQYVLHAAKYKKSSTDVQAEDRVKAMLETRKKWSLEQKIDSEFIAQIFKTMIAFFVGEEMARFKLADKIKKR